jgi:hypothetical protein
MIHSETLSDELTLADQMSPTGEELPPDVMTFIESYDLVYIPYAPARPPNYYFSMRDNLVFSDIWGTPNELGDYLDLTNERLWMEVINFPAIFGDIAGADRYFSSVLHGEMWEHTCYEKKMKALVTATQAINELRFAGQKTNPRQPLEWPRNCHVLTPLGVLQATYEEALSLLKGIDPATEASNLYVKSRVFGRLQRVQTDYDFSLHAPEHVVAGIASYRAWQLLKPFLSPAKGVRLRRRS